MERNLRVVESKRVVYSRRTLNNRERGREAATRTTAIATVVTESATAGVGSESWRRGVG